MRFPTRQYPYRGSQPNLALDDAADPLAAITAGSVVRFHLGADTAAMPMDAAEIDAALQDAFGRIVLAKGHRPLTLVALLALLEAATGADAFSELRFYRVADGGQIAWGPGTELIDRHLRLVITGHRGDTAEIFVSTAPSFDSETIFLQVFAWDPVNMAFNFYERRRGLWSWAGSSWQALEPPTRGQGPFDSHVNGGPVMKELKLPWMHWHSQSARIGDEMLAPDDPLRSDPIWTSDRLKGAEDLERIVRAETTRWVDARFARRMVNGRLTRLPEFLRQVLQTTTVNLTTSPQRSALLAAGDQLRLPTTAFVNADSLGEDLGLPLTLARLKAPAAFYLDALTKFKVRIQDHNVSLEQDAFFAFAVPEAPLEDRVVLATLVRRGFISRRLAACLMMVDFPNPVFSDARAALLQYVPAEAGPDAAELDAALPAAISAAACAAGPERDFAALWDVGPVAWEAVFVARIEAYWARLAEALADPDGFDAIFRLADSRRRQFRNRPLAEFGLTMPVATSLVLPRPLRMTETGQVVELFS